MSPASGRRAWRRVDGVLLLDKPPGVTSNAALQRARRLFGAAKAGHTGTLDPLASGLLPVCFGEATKFAQALLDAPKRYTATIRFGAATATGDAEGEVIERGSDVVDEATLRAVLAGFVGRTLQQPPRHAALKHEGRPYYDYARAGVDIPRAPRAITIERLALVGFAPPLATIDVACSKGTYVRVLAEDIGRALRTCAHLAALRRTATGGFELAQATTFDALAAGDDAARDALLLPVDALVAALPRVVLDAADANALRCGRPVRCAPEGPLRLRAYDSAGELIGVVLRDDATLRAERLLATGR